MVVDSHLPSFATFMLLRFSWWTHPLHPLFCKIPFTANAVLFCLGDAIF
ncbi:hypothetical protein EVA_05475 [gut metagenome]|uniref:Uncharacterized protein n=1 Tax=gut metagenome TaxID=749906 RepID=J9GGB1_9ZZZZ